MEGKESPGDNEEKHKNSKEFTIDEDFFSNELMPIILSSLMSSIPPQSAHIILVFYAFDIALKKKSISLPEQSFFFKHFLTIPNCYSWSEFDTNFFSSVQGINFIF